MLRRRPLLVAAAAGWAVARAARAERTPESALALRCGVDRSLAASGLARALQLAFGRDTGIAVKLVPAPALATLDAVRNGEVDVALCNAPEAEAALEKQGLIHGWQRFASGDFVIVGPARRGRQPAWPRDLDAAGALAHLAELASAEPASLRFVSANDGSGVHIVEQRLWREARIAPAAPWYVPADPAHDFLHQVGELSAWALVERGAWLALGGGGLAIVVAGDPLLVEAVHVMRSFHASHPAGRIFAAWIGGVHGRAVARAHRGYRAAR